MKIIGNFELVDHGIEHSQYFQGCGVSYTLFNHVVTGIGDNLSDAVDDCLEQIALNWFETEDMDDRILKREGWDTMPLTPNAYELHGSDNEMHYHVSIRWNEAKPETP